MTPILISIIAAIAVWFIAAAIGAVNDAETAHRTGQ